MHAPHELPDEPIVQRLQDRFQCTVVNTRRNKHQGTDIPNGIRTYSVIMRKDLPATMRYGRFVIRFHSVVRGEDVTSVVKRAM